MNRPVKRIIRLLKGRPFRNEIYEHQFQAAYRQSGIRVGYLFSWMAAMSFAFFSAVEYFVYQRPLSDSVQVLRATLIILFLCVGIHAKAKTHLYEKHFEAIVFLLQAIYVSGVLYFEYASQIAGRAEFFYLSVNSMCILVTIASYCFMRLTRALAVQQAAFFAAATFLAVYVSGVYDATVFGRMVTYITVANITGFAIRQIFDMRERRMFLQTQKLKNVAALRRRLIEAETAANVAKTNFLAMLGHEIRTPMNTIVRLVEIIQRDLREHLTEKRITIFKSVGQSCDQLLSTFDDMLEFAELGNTSSRSVIQARSFSPCELFQDCANLLRYRAEEKHLYLNISDTDLSKVQLVGDPQRLGRVIVNLIANAIKFTSNGGIDLNATGKKVNGQFALTIDITDTGIGIPLHEQRKIFQPFYQVDSSNVRKYGGSGLGLAICAHILEAMNGTIGVSSELGKGTRFSIELTLPVAVDAIERSVTSRSAAA